MIGRASLVLFGLVLFGCSALAGASVSPESEPPALQEQIEVRRLLLRAVVRPGLGARASCDQWTADDLVVRDAGRLYRPQTVASVDQPTLFIFVFDVSASIPEEFLRGMVDAVRRDVETAPSSDRFAVFAFDDLLMLHSSALAGREETLRALANVTRGSGTALWDSLATIAGYARTLRARTAVLLFTDGEEASLRDAKLPTRTLSAFLASGASVFVISPRGIGARNILGLGPLQQIAIETGGASLWGSRPPAVMEQVRAQLGRELEIWYAPESARGASTGPATVELTHRRRCRVLALPPSTPIPADDAGDAMTIPLASAHEVDAGQKEPLQLRQVTQRRFEGLFVDRTEAEGAVLVPSKRRPERLRQIALAHTVWQARAIAWDLPPIDDAAGLARDPLEALQRLGADERPGTASRYILDGDAGLELWPQLSAWVLAHRPDYAARLRAVAPTLNASEIPIERPGFQWLADLTVQQLLEAADLRHVRALLAGAEPRLELERAESDVAAGRAWFLGGSTRRVLAPLTPLAEAKTGRIGFVRVILPVLGRTADQRLPRRPLAMRAVLALGREPLADCRALSVVYESPTAEERMNGLARAKRALHSGEELIQVRIVFNCGPEPGRIQRLTGLFVSSPGGDEQLLIGPLR